MTDWNAKDPETGEPVHVRMGLTEDCQGPADPPDPAFHHWGCWCSDRHCPGPPRWTDLFGIDPNYLEGVPEEPTYTASEVKVLTEAALRLGRVEAAEEIAAALLSFMANDIRGRSDMDIDRAAAIALDIGYKPSGASSDATSGVPGHPEVSEAVRSPQEPRGVHEHWENLS